MCSRIVMFALKFCITEHAQVLRRAHANEMTLRHSFMTVNIIDMSYRSSVVS